MRKIELLAPAGSLEALKAAVNSGADAVYLGGTLFNARAFAANFTDEELEEAVTYAHLRNVRIYVTVNTLFYDDEFEDLMNYVDRLYQINVDALIIQDLGLMKLVQTYYPDFEIHASTQVSIHQLSGVQAMEEQGIKRVVLARENTIEEIAYIAQNTNLEIEVFVHGALCMCYSGQCLMSSLIGKRSGNRGKCAQPCRLPYKLKLDQKALDYQPHYLLSAKDICVIENIGDYIEAGVTSFKIEGRMKRPEYVAAVVKNYRQAIDEWQQNRELSDKKEQVDEMFQMFNRGLSKGHAYHESKIITDIFPGNFGVEIGKVTGYDKNEQQVFIKLAQPLTQGDGIRFGYEDNGRIVNKMYYRNRLVNKANAGDEVGIEFNIKIKDDTPVFKTSSVELIQRLAKEYNDKKIKTPIDLSLQGKMNEPLKLVLTCQGKTVVVDSQVIIEEAKQSALALSRIEQQLSKLGNTVYVIRKLNISLPENIQFPIKELNELRRQGIEKMDQLRLQHDHHSQSVHLLPEKIGQRTIKDIHVHVQNLQQCKVAINEGIKTVYYPFNDEGILEALTLVKTNKAEVIPYVARIIDDAHLHAIKESSLYQQIDKILVGDIGAVYAFKDKEVMMDSSLNITNSYALAHPLIQGNDVIVSAEMSQMRIDHLQTSHNKIGVVTYGRLETMITKYCPISQQQFGCQKFGCNLCKKGQYYLVDRKGEQFPMLMDDECRMHLYNAKIQYVDELENLKADFIILKMTLENEEEVKQVVNDYQHILKDHERSWFHGNKEYTLGYLK